MIEGRYMLFAGDNYYPGGGIRDLVHASNDILELKFIVAKAEIVDHPPKPATSYRAGDAATTGLLPRDPDEIIHVPPVPGWREFRREFDWAEIYDSEDNATSEARIDGRRVEVEWTEWKIRV